MTSLLDMLKETDLRVNFTQQFKGAVTRENLPRGRLLAIAPRCQTLQKRLILGIYGLGTNTGFKRIAAGDPDVKYKDLLYVRRRFLITEHLRAAIAQVVNAIFRARSR